MKVTMKMFYDRFLSGMQRNMEAVIKDSEQLSTGKRIGKPSDDPTAMSRIINYNTMLSSTGEYLRSITTAKGPLEAFDSAFITLGENITRATELALSGANGTMDPRSRTMIAKEVDGLIGNAIRIANTKVGDRYIFAGFQSNVPPINATTGEFVSDTSSLQVDIGLNVKIALNISAGDIFSFRKTSAADPQNAVLPPYNWDNGGTITIPDADPISALHTSKGDPERLPAVASFTSSGDVFSSNGGTLTITVGDNDQSPVTVTLGAAQDADASGDYSLDEVRNAINAQAGSKVKAEVVNFNTTGNPANDDFRIVIASKPVGSSDKIKITVTTADGAGTGLNDLAYDPTGAQSMLLGTNITNYNYITDPSHPNYYSFNNNYLNENNLLRALHFLKASLESNDVGRIQKSLGYLNKLSDKLAQFTAEIGARLNKIDAEESYHDDREYNVKTYLSNEQDTDIAKVVTDMSQRQVALEGLRAVSTDFMRTSLFDFLR
ncbi:MAG: flagellar hook-associated protein FlgL [Nitrospirota bacterium]